MIRLKLFIAFILAAIGSPFAATAQNLVINGDFDEPNVCTEYEAKCSPSGWFYVYATGPGWGYRPGINTSPYAIQLFSARRRDATRSFWQTMLTQPVVPGQQYTLQIEVVPEKGDLNLDDIGVVLTDKMRFAVYADYKIPENYISFTDAKITKLKDGWYRLTKTCSFTESMQVLVVGNFSGKSNKQILDERENKEGFIVTNIDNLSLIPEGNVAMASTTGITAAAVKDSLYQIRDRHRGLLEIVGGKSFLPVDNGKYKPTRVTRSDTLIIPDIAFDFDSYQLADRPSLVRQLQPLFRGKISKIVVEGFTDNKGSISYNDTLSTQRAGAVANLLTTEFPLVKYVTESKGSGISTKYDDDSKNRRVEIIIFRSQE